MFMSNFTLLMHNFSHYIRPYEIYSAVNVETISCFQHFFHTSLTIRMRIPKVGNYSTWKCNPRRRVKALSGHIWYPHPTRKCIHKHKMKWKVHFFFKFTIWFHQSPALNWFLQRGSIHGCIDTRAACMIFIDTVFLTLWSNVYIVA